MNLFDIPAVSLGISLVICWSLFAILCSLVHEAFVRVKSERGRFLKKMILEQFKDNVNGINWGLRVYQQGSVSMLSADPSAPTDDLDPKVFSASFVSAIGGVQALNERLQTLVSKVEKNPEEIAVLEQINNYQNPFLRQFAAACLLFQPSEPISLAKNFLSRAELWAIKPPGGLDEQILYGRLLSEIESWYGEFEDRLTFWYKSKTKTRIFWLGALLALIVNFDSLQLFNQLNYNPAVEKVALDAYGKNGDKWSKLIPPNDSILLKSQGGVKQVKEQIDSMHRFTQSLDKLVKESGLPVGWKYNIFNNPYCEIRSFVWYILKLLGILVSGIVASLGASFWFDILKKAYTLKSK
jgi:hypothetical protein